MQKPQMRLTVMVCVLAGWLGWNECLRAEVDEATAKRVKEVIAGVEAATKPIVDLSCTVEVSQRSGVAREYWENQLRKWEIVKKKGVMPADRADKRIAEDRASLNTPERPEEIIENSKWMMRFDGLFHVIQRNTYPGGSTTEMAFDGRESRFYAPSREHG